MNNVIRNVAILISSFLILLFSLTYATAEKYSYKIIEVNRLGNIKCSITVRLSNKVSEETLRKLALKLRDEEPKKYDRMFITYYLPGMTVGAGAWATTHFDPDLDVRIIGMTVEQEKNLLKETKKISGKIIGIWIDEIYGKYSIIKKGSGYILEMKFKDGSGITEDLIKYKYHGKTAFKEKDENRGEYFILEDSGALGLYDSVGLITKMHKVK